MTKRLLLAGESWVSSATHYKGFDQFGSVTFHTGAGPFIKALEAQGFDVTFMPAHEAAEGFPFEAGGLAPYDAIILSDIGANTLLLPPAVWLQSKTVPNRLKLIRDYVLNGGGLLMAGGYFSFQGIDGKARWRRTAVEEVLPVTCLPWDDRIEMPEGTGAEIVDGAHPVLAGMGGNWPPMLGVNEVEMKPDGRLLARLPADQGGHPLLAVGQYGKGRSAVWTSDIGPHWLSPAFCEWDGYGRLWKNLLGWLTTK